MTRDLEENEFNNQDERSQNERPTQSRPAQGSSEEDARPRGPKKVTFDDFQITRSQQQQQVEEERQVWKERQERMEQQKPALLRFAGSRLRSVRDEMIGSFFKKKESDIPQEPESYRAADEPYFAEHEKSVIHVTRKHDEAPDGSLGEQSHREQSHRERSVGAKPAIQAIHDDRALINRYYEEEPAEKIEKRPVDEAYAEDDYLEDADEDFSDDIDEERVGARELGSDLEYEDEVDDEVDDDEDDENSDGSASIENVFDTEDALPTEIIVTPAAGPAEVIIEEELGYDDEMSREEQTAARDDGGVQSSATAPHRIYIEDNPSRVQEDHREENPVRDEPEIEPSLMSFLDALRAFDSHPKRAHDSRDPRADFVLLLSELLDILREQVDAMSAMFFWVNTKKQQLVLESAALDDRAYQFLAADKRFPIELDAVSRVVTKKKPELHSVVQSQAELDLIPYYRDAIGVASFAGMPVLFGDGLVAVLTVDSTVEENFTQETLRILTTHSKLISGLIRSYIEKYDLLASARTLESARKLHQIVSPDTTQRVLREQRKNPDYILRALTEAASEISDWDWLATTSFDDSRRLWSINALQSKHNGSYVPPQTPISLNESIVGKCLQSGRASRHDALNAQSIRYNLEEDRSGAAGHSFMVIPIRTTNKNYGALAIEHSERARFTDADVETLEHLTRSAAAALEIIALSEIVGERALTDLLTGVLNKRGLLQRLNEELARAMEFDEPLTLVFFEIDNAAELFSRFSQEDSDTIVLAITRLLRFGSRAFDVVARVGEHSFATVMVQMSDEDAYLWSEKMRKMIVSEVIAIGRRSFSVTVSIGVSGARRDGTVEELIEGAELAIERAHEMGGNNVIVY